MTTETPAVPLGALLAGKYRVERVLGAGGMGIVVAATHLELQQLVAVKFLHGGMLTNGEAVARFVREARAAARIQSEHVARVIDVGRLEDGAPYMVMEFLRGEDLAALLEKGPLPVELAVEYLLQACHAVAEAHAAGIVHRDLKPSNLFLTGRADGLGVIKVLDFGISKLTSTDGFEPQLTTTKSAMGSPLYMSPEQMRSARDVDHRTDLWSLGVILYELVSGKTPFNGGSMPELVTSVLMSTPDSLNAQRPDVPLALDAVALRCLEKEPAARFANVGELALALSPFVPAHSQGMVERVARIAGSVRPAVPELQSSSEPAPDVSGKRTDASWSRTRGSSASSARSRVVIVVAVFAVLSLGIAALLQRGAPAEGANAASVPPREKPALAPEPVVSAAPSLVAEPAVADPRASADVSAGSAPSGRLAPPSPAPRAARASAPPLATGTAGASPPSVLPAPTASAGVRRKTLEIGLK